MSPTGVTFVPKGYLVVSVDVFGCHNVGVATGVEWVESWDAVK